MSTIAENLTKLAEDRDNIATAISSKGVTVPEGSKLSEFPEMIEDIETKEKTWLTELGYRQAMRWISGWDLNNLKDLPLYVCSNNSCAVYYHNEIHLIGGYSSNSHYKYNGSLWELVSIFPQESLNSPIVFIHNDEINVISNTSHYKFNGDTWVSVSTLPGSASYNCDAVSYDDKIYLFERSYCYVWDGATWTRKMNNPISFEYRFRKARAIVYNNEIHILGDDTYHYKLVNDTWVSVSTLPRKILGGSVFTYKEELYIIGGYYEKIYQHSYKWDGVKWEYTDLLETSKFYNGLTIINNNEIHRLGGYNGDSSTAEYGYTTYGKYHYVGNTDCGWKFSIIEKQQEQASCVVYKNEVHLLGLYNGSNFLYHYKWSGYSWIYVGQLPYSLNYGSAVVYGDNIHILGGQNGYTAHYKFDGSSWSRVSTIPYNYYRGQAVVYNNEIHILGSDVSGNYTKHYKWNGVTWTEVSTIPYEFCCGAAVVYDNKIHLIGSGYGYPIGGYTTSSNYKNHYTWDGEVWTKIIDANSNNIAANYSGNPYSGATVYNGDIHFIWGDRHCIWNGITWNVVKENIDISQFNKLVSYKNSLISFGGYNNIQGYYIGG